MSKDKIVKALTNAMPHDILVNANWTLYKDSKAKDIEIERLNNIINELEKYLEEEKDRLARETSNIYEDSFGKANFVNEDIFKEVGKIKYKMQELKGSEEK